MVRVRSEAWKGDARSEGEAVLEVRERKPAALDNSATGGRENLGATGGRAEKPATGDRILTPAASGQEER